MYRSTTDETTRPDVPYPRKILLCWLGLFLALGVVAGLMGKAGNQGALDLANALICLVLTYAWCRAEARERGRIVPAGYTMFACLFPPLGLPVYFIRTRETAGRAALSTVKALGFYLALSALLNAASALVHLLRS